MKLAGDLDSDLDAYFRDHVDKALKEEHLEPNPPTGEYLVRLLAAYAAQPIEDRPLALRLFEALGAPPRERRAQLREIGDTSLYLSGFWADSLASKAVDVDYYIEMGGAAYGELARASREANALPIAAVFAELATHFARFVEVLMIISHRTCRNRGNRDVVRLYERWLRTKSRWAARSLVEVGVMPPRRAPGMVQ